MSIDTAEQLKNELTDKYVVVKDGVPELRRFAGFTGRVKTVNMNCRALVEFDSPEDIGWYDIDPSYLTTVNAPAPKKKAAEKPKADAKAPAKGKAAAKKGGGLSPLEQARQQGAAGSEKAAAPAQKAAKKPAKGLSPLELARQQGAVGSGKGPSAEAAKAPADKKPTAGLSPLELARQQGAIGSGKGAAATPAKSKESAAPKGGDKKLSPLELARQQGAFKGDSDAQADSTTAEASATEEAPVDPVADSAKKSSVPPTGPDGKPLSIIERARLEGPFKG